MKTRLIILVLAASVGQLDASVVFYEEIPYFSAADSPFYEGIQQGTIYFEDRQLNTPYVVFCGALKAEISRLRPTFFGSG